METIEWFKSIPVGVLWTLGGGVIVGIGAMLFLAVELFKNGQAIRSLAKNTQMNEFSQVLTNLKNLDNNAVSISHQFTSIQNQLSIFEKSLDAKDQEELETDLEDQTEKRLKPEELENAIESALKNEGKNAEMLYKEIEAAWQGFSEVLKKKVEARNRKYEGRSMRSSAKQLTHGNLKNGLTDDDVELIAKLHSQYKRFARLQSSKDKWLTPNVYTEFKLLLDEAKKKVEMV